MIQASDNELIRNVKADLRHLNDNWNNLVDNDTLRRESVVLRRLMNNGDLQRAWKAAGFSNEPTIKSASLEQKFRTFPLKQIDWAFAGGAIYRNMQVTHW